MVTADVTWDPPEPGQWYPVLDHFPKPSCRLFIELFPMMTTGWVTGARRYGVPGGGSRWAAINHWLYYSPADPGPEDLESLDATAKETLESRRWRSETAEWLHEERPAVVRANLELQAEDLAALDDGALADHLRRALDHYANVAPLHFSHQAFRYAAGALATACAEWGIERDDLVPLLAGASGPATEVRDFVARIAGALRATGVEAVGSLEDVRAAGGEAAVALDELLQLHGWRLVENRDLVDPALVERPELLVASVNVALGGSFAGSPVDRSTELAAVRARVPAAGRADFDRLLAETRAAYGMGDDDEGVCFLWPLGLIRRAVLEAGRRLRARGRLHDPADLLEADRTEIFGLLEGAASPTADELRGRVHSRRRAAALSPPPVGDAPATGDRPAEALPPHVQQLLALGQQSWHGHGPPTDEPLRGRGIGDRVHRGRACFVTDGGDALDRLRPGDVLVAIATNPGFNAVFPIVGAVVTEEGGLMCHAAVLARELGVPAVVGVGAIRTIRDGDLIEVDAPAGIVRIL